MIALATLYASVHLASVETILAAGVFVVLMIGTFRGDRSLVPLTWVAVGILALAGVFLLAVPGGGATAFGGLYVGDAFSTFLKVLILGGAAVSMVLALPYLRESATARFRISRAPHAVGAGDVHDGQRQRPADALRRARAAEPRRLCAGGVPPQRGAVERGWPQVFRPRCAGERHPALRHQPGVRLHRDDELRRAPRPRPRHGRGRPRHADRAGLHSQRPRLQDQRRAVPYVDARRL